MNTPSLGPYLQLNFNNLVLHYIKLKRFYNDKCYSLLGEFSSHEENEVV